MLPEDISEIPRDLLPPCETCLKPELDYDNYETVGVWGMVKDQRSVDGFSGVPGSLHAESVIAMLDELGIYDHQRERVFSGLWILDEVWVKIQRDRAAAAAKSPGATFADEEH